MPLCGARIFIGKPRRAAQTLVVGYFNHFCGFYTDKTKVQYTAVWSAAKIAFDHVIALISANGQSNAAATEEVVSPMQQTLTPNER